MNLTIILDESKSRKKSVVLCLGAAEAAISLINSDKRFENTGARPKRSSLKKPIDSVRMNSFHQQR